MTTHPEASIILRAIDRELAPIRRLLEQLGGLGKSAAGLKRPLDAASAIQAAAARVRQPADATQAVAQIAAASGVTVSGRAASESGAYPIARSNPRDHAQAQVAIRVASDLIGATKSLTAARAAIESATPLLIANQSLGDNSKEANAGIAALADLHKPASHFADLAKAREEIAPYHFGFNPRSIRGGASSAAATMEKSATPLFGRLNEALNTLRTGLGESMLAPLTAIANRLAAVGRGVAEFARANPAMNAFAVSFDAIAASMAPLPGPAAGLAAPIDLIGAASAPLRGAGEAIAGIAAASAPASAVSAALARSIAGGLARLAAGGHHAGVNFARTLAAGILSNAHLVESAVTSVAQKIREHPTFSRAEAAARSNLNRDLDQNFKQNFNQGFNQDLNLIRMVETLGETIRRAPAISAIRRVAAAIAIAAPIVAAPMVTPALAFARGVERTPGPGILARPVATRTININYAPTLNISGIKSDIDFARMLAEHRRKLLEEIRRAQADENRRDF